MKIHRTAGLADFKRAIREEIPNQLRDIDANELELFKVEVPITNDKVPPNPKLSDENILHPANDIGEEFPMEPPGKHIHVFVKRPSGK